MRRLLVLVMSLGFVACVSAKAAEAPPPAGGHGGPGKMELPDHFTNLKVLPKDISKEQLGATMRAFSRGLGVHCDYCHVTKPTKDWAKDTERKNIARIMVKMVATLNHDYFSPPNAPKATCYMCHRGAEKPVFAPPPMPAMGRAGPPSASPEAN